MQGLTELLVTTWLAAQEVKTPEEVVAVVVGLLMQPVPDQAAQES
jgi:hypothetical protein